MTSIGREVYLAWLSGADLPLEILTGAESVLSAPENFYDELMNGLDMDGYGIPAKYLTVLKRSGDSDHLIQLDECMKKHGIKAMTIVDEDYPEDLYPLNDPPAILYYAGNINALHNPSAAMVGSRAASWKGMTATEKFARRLSEAGITVISGLAAGIDTYAHKGCLTGGSATIAVMGCGLDIDYPAQNKELRKMILNQGGLFLSEYPPGEKPLNWHFPVRNRIISGLADCLIVMEAQIRSGTMTTVRHALEQGKDVFVYPGDPDSIKFEGNRQLLREGAIYFTEAEDILEDMRWLDKKNQVGQNKSADVFRGLSGEEKRVAELLKNGERSFDEICTVLQSQTSALMTVLTKMQMKSLIEQMPGQLYRLKEV